MSPEDRVALPRSPNKARLGVYTPNLQMQKAPTLLWSWSLCNTKMGQMTGVEPANADTTNRSLNHLATPAISCSFYTNMSVAIGSSAIGGTNIL